MYNLHAYLCDKHGGINIKECYVIIKKYTGCEISEPAKVQLPPLLELLILVLGQPVRALQCDGETCEFISINHKEILKHCNRVHDWRYSIRSPVHWKTVHAQTFFISGGYRWYFVIQDPGGDDNSSDKQNNSQPDRADLVLEYADDAAVIKHK